MNRGHNFVLAFIVSAAAFLGTAGVLFAQTGGNSPVALIVSYRVRPESRARFRRVMSTEGVAQLNRWKREGVFASYNALFTAYAGSTAVADMFLVLRFNRFTDLARWQQIEKNYPGGLPESAQRMVLAEFSATADILGEDHAATSARDSQYLVLEYDVLADMTKYTSYVRGYAAPQFKAWMKAGILTSYAAFANQNPAGAPWSSLILLEYKELRSLAERETVKTKARADLANSDPAWKRWSDDKTAIRREIAAIPALPLR